MRPPFEITPAMLLEVDRISKLLGRLEGQSCPPPRPAAARANRIRSIRSTLAIEGNSLSIDQVTAVLAGRRVAGSAREMLEVRNADSAYEVAPKLDPRSMRDFLRAHGIMMGGLAVTAGKFRTCNVGVASGRRVLHLAPPAHQVRRLVEELLRFVRDAGGPHPLVTACVVHYEIELIHPFEDGNGRMGRLWQHILCLCHDPVFEHVPVEAVIHDRRQSYYRAIAESNAAGSSTPFVEFSLVAIRDSLGGYVDAADFSPVDAGARLARARDHFGGTDFSRKDYVRLFRSISTATASRDLASGVSSKALVRTGDRAVARYRFA